MNFHAVRGARVMFSIWETRVSDWKAFLRDRQSTWLHWPAFSQTDEDPVANVTEEEAIEFCDWLTQRERAARILTGTQGYRLPTNEEWDVAVGLSSRTGFAKPDGGIEQSVFPWGAEWPPPPKAGNYNSAYIAGAGDDGFRFTAPVGRYHPTPDNLFDLGGNVWEWTVDSKAEETVMACLRGGSWMYWRKGCLESSFQFREKRGVRAPSIGFRCVLADEAEVDAVRQRDVAEAESKRRELTARPKVSDEEIRSALAQLAARRVQSASDAKEMAEGGSAAPSLISLPNQAAAANREFTNSTGIRMIPLPGSNVLLAEHEVRMADFDAYLAQNDLPKRRDAGFTSSPNLPITGVTWEEAVSFCLWLTQRERVRGLLPPDASYRLPLLAEWKTAVREGPPGASDSFHYPWGNTWPPPGDCANVGGPNGLPASSKAGQLLPVKSLRSNGFGFFDLVGNAAEWCHDFRPATEMERIYCGGSWASSTPDDLQDGGTREIPAATARSDVGFRLALGFRPTEKPSLQSRLKADRE